jgi:hypothetical protein
MQKNFLKEILKSPETIFSFKELLLKFRTTDSKTLKSKLKIPKKSAARS